VLCKRYRKTGKQEKTKNHASKSKLFENQTNVHRNCKQDLSLGGYTSRTAWAAKKDLSLGGYTSRTAWAAKKDLSLGYYTSRTAWAAKRLCIEKKGNKS
jgi:hypothetical protein